MMLLERDGRVRRVRRPGVARRLARSLAGLLRRLAGQDKPQPDCANCPLAQLGMACNGCGE